MGNVIATAMANTETFKSDEFGQIRTVTINNEPWLVGKDVATALGYSNPRKALIDHVDEEDKTDGVTIRDSMGRSQNPIIINESGLYSLILSSKLPTAKMFKRWVTSEVLPSIRKKGYYIDKTSFDTPITREEVAMYFSYLMDSLETFGASFKSGVETTIKGLASTIALQNETIIKQNEEIIGLRNSITEIKDSNIHVVDKTTRISHEDWDEIQKWRQKAFASIRIISKKSGKSTNQCFREVFSVMRKNGVNLTEMLDEYKERTRNPRARVVSMIAENPNLYSSAESAFKQVNKKYSYKGV